MPANLLDLQEPICSVSLWKVCKKQLQNSGLLCPDRYYTRMIFLKKGNIPLESLPHSTSMPSNHYQTTKARCKLGLDKVWLPKFPYKTDLSTHLCGLCKESEHSVPLRLWCGDLWLAGGKYAAVGAWDCLSTYIIQAFLVLSLDVLSFHKDLCVWGNNAVGTGLSLYHFELHAAHPPTHQECIILRTLQI